MHWADTTLEHGPMPLWAQIAARLRTAIAEGAFTSGDLLPGEAELNHVFGVSRTTARAALDRLEQEGLIVRRSGRGSIVLPPRVDRPLNLLSSFAEDMRARGWQASYITRFVRREPAPADIAAALEIADATPVLVIDRLLCADGKPIATSLTHLAPHVPAPNLAELDSGSLYRWLEDRAGIRLVAGHEQIEAALAGEEIGQRLNLPASAPVLVSRRISRGTDNKPVEHVRSHYRADQYRFQVELVRP